MRRIKLEIAYDGSDYQGWQLQKDKPTIEGALNQALLELTGDVIHVIGASRTDSGVHARGNVAVFDTNHKMPGDKFCYALNQRLPSAIRVQKSVEVDIAWHPRKCNCIKTYRYQIQNRRIEFPEYRFYSYFCYLPLEIEWMKEAASELIGEYDFKSFCTAQAHVEDTVRTIHDIKVEKENDIITIEVTGDGFLYNMVRIIAGTLIQVGAGQFKPPQIKNMLRTRDRVVAGKTAPAHGLTLMGINYDLEEQNIINSKTPFWNYIFFQMKNARDEEQVSCLIIEQCEQELFESILKRNKKRTQHLNINKMCLIDKSNNISEFIIENYQLVKMNINDKEIIEKNLLKNEKNLINKRENLLTENGLYNIMYYCDVR